MPDNETDPSLTPPMAATPTPAGWPLRAMLGLAIALLGPLALLAMAWTAQRAEAQASAWLHAELAARAWATPGPATPDGWRRAVQAVLDAVPPAVPERRTILDDNGRLVAGTATPIPWPVLHAEVALRLPGDGSGRVVITRSLAPALWQASGVALVGVLLLAGVARGPRRRRPDPSAGPDAATSPLTQLLFDAAADGIVVFDERSLVQQCNPRAAAMFGLTPQAVVGQPLTRWVTVDARGGAGGPYPPGRSETVVQRGTGADRQRLPCEWHVTALPATGARPRRLSLGTLRDLSEQRAAEQRIRSLAEYDSLTGLPNRNLFRDRLARALDRAERSGRHVALMFLDLDRFKHVNDSLGHSSGDRLLQHVAATLTAALRGADSVARGHGEDDAFTVARLGGDEFTVIVEDLGSADDALRVAERLQRALQTPFALGGHELVVTASIGITVYPDDRCPPEMLVKHADLAMYRAKDQGRNAVQFFSSEMNDHAQRRLQMEAELRQALERGEFHLEFQPKADVHSGRISGVEALLRWQRGGQPVAPPDQFVPLLEDTGLILPVGRWVMAQAAAQVCAWRQAGLPWVRVAVNLSARQLRQADLADTVAEVLEQAGLPSAQLELELTESMLMSGQQHVQTLARLSALGVLLAIDDFGTGYSSLSYLKRLNVDTLKIDRSFVQDMPGDAEANAIAIAVIALARSMKLRTVAEGVETPAQRQFLLAHGCDEMQGYIVSPPMPAAAFERWWRERLAVDAETPMILG